MSRKSPARRTGLAVPLRTVVIILFALIFAIIAGFLAWIGGAVIAHAVLAALGVAVGTTKFLHWITADEGK